VTDDARNGTLNYFSI